MSGAGCGPKVVVVDDDPMVLRLLRRILSQAGFDVEALDNPEEARSFLQTNSCFLLITDLHMPGGNGLDLVRDLRRRTADLPVLILSGSLEEEVRQEAARLGRVDCMSKPIDPDRLLAVVRTLIDGSPRC